MNLIIVFCFFVILLLIWPKKADPEAQKAADGELYNNGNCTSCGFGTYVYDGIVCEKPEVEEHKYHCRFCYAEILTTERVDI